MKLTVGLFHQAAQTVGSSFSKEAWMEKDAKKVEDPG
jgi:hypothetical protein